MYIPIVFFTLEFIAAFTLKFILYFTAQNFLVFLLFIKLLLFNELIPILTLLLITNKLLSVTSKISTKSVDLFDKNGVYHIKIKRYGLLRATIKLLIEAIIKFCPDTEAGVFLIKKNIIKKYFLRVVIQYFSLDKILVINGVVRGQLRAISYIKLLIVLRTQNKKVIRIYGRVFILNKLFINIIMGVNLLYKNKIDIIWDFFNNKPVFRVKGYFILLF